jgi:substrate import-associated zinc metallohydrolase lipoprotein
LLSSVIALLGCRKEPALNPESIITVPTKEQNAFDKWLEANYVNPYNIVVKYRYEMNESDYSYYTIPADMDCSIIMAHLVKYMCIDSYDEVAGAAFTRRYFPKMFFYIGEWEYKNNGTYILGTAEGGKKVYLTGVNYIPEVLAGQYQGHKDPAEAVNHFYVKTIHHEFTHILNQTKDFPADFTQVTPTEYVNDSWNDTPDYLARGFISAYAQASDREDFAETASLFITNTPEWWSAQMLEAGTSGSALITTKLDIVKSYFKTSFGINLEDLRSTVLRRQQEVMSGEIDLTSLEIL